MTRARLALASAVLSALACSPRPIAPPELLVVVETDAPLPAQGAADGSIALFDRLRVAVYTGDAAAPCEGCVREFVLDEGSPPSLSVGVAATSDAAVAKVTLFALRNATRDGEPDPGSSLTAWIRLPRLADGDVRALYVPLRVGELGAPRGDRSAPTEAASSPTDPPLVRWPDARRVACTATAAADEVCVPGGIVWMGNARRTPGPAGGLLARLVKISPFILDRHEVTVRAYRASGLALAGGLDPDISPANLCTYAAGPGPTDDHPVNCIEWSSARAFCKAQGKDLPTEAQLEYVEGGMRGARYPWGDTDPRCGELAFGQSADASGGCGLLRGTTAVGASQRDAVAVAGGALSDLAGNVSEWARDAWHGEDDACNMQGFFRGPGVPRRRHEDPRAPRRRVRVRCARGALVRAHSGRFALEHHGLPLRARPARAVKSPAQRAGTVHPSEPPL